MPLFRNRTAFQIAKGARAFLHLDTGVVRGEAPLTPEALEKTQALLRQQLANKDQQLAEARRALENKDHQISGLKQELGAHAVSPGNIVWIFGTVRTGSTWLASMMRDPRMHAMWNEPRVGELFGAYFYGSAAHRKENENFVLGLQRKLVWLKSVRNFVLDAASARYPGFAEDGILVIKEPSGSIGAPLLMDALPESRMVLLVRDPRDVVASALDAAREGSWAYELGGIKRREKGIVGDTGVLLDDFTGKSPDQVVEDQAMMYLRYVGNSKRAYDAHDGRKTLVRYEDLVADTLGTMKRVYSELEIEVDDEELARTVEEHSWGNIPEEKKGEGKFYRKATPGGWREDLTAEQIEVVEEITAPLLKEIYPESGEPR